jgi:hypothetical protein
MRVPECGCFIIGGSPDVGWLSYLPVNQAIVSPQPFLHAKMHVDPAENGFAGLLTAKVHVV